MGHPWDSLFYRFKGLGDCISKLVNSFGVTYEEINERNPTVHATTPIAELPSVEVIQDPTSGTYTRRVCVPLIAPQTILRKRNSTVTRVALKGDKAKLLVSRKFIEEVRPIEPLTCEWNANIVPFGGWVNHVDMTIGIDSQTFSSGGMLLGATNIFDSTSDYNALYYFHNPTYHSPKGLPYTMLSGIDGVGNNPPTENEDALFLVIDDVYADNPTFPVYEGISTNPIGAQYGAKVEYLSFSQSWRGTGLIRDMLSRTGMDVENNDFSTLAVDSCKFYGFGYLKGFVQNTDGANGANALGELQWQAILDKSPWAGNWHLNGQFVVSVGYTSFNLYGNPISFDIDLPSVDTASVSGAETWRSDDALQFFQTYGDPYYKMLHLTHNANVPRITSMKLTAELYGYIQATQGGKVSFRVRASDRWKGASSAEKQACYWNNYYPYCWLSTGVEAVYVSSVTGQSYQLIPTETLGALTRYELRATPYEILGDNDQTASIDVYWTGTNNHIGSMNYATQYNQGWDYNLVNVDAEETCSYKHWY